MDLATKLQLKAEQPLQCVDAPGPIDASIVRPAGGGADGQEPALLVFAVDRAALDARREQIVGAASQDRLTWVAYPKAGQLSTDLSRDVLAATLVEEGVRPVRQVAIDAVWSALRFRPGR